MDNELHRPITKNFQRHKLYSSERDNIWSPDNGYVQLISKNNNGGRFLPCVTGIYSKHVWVVPQKNKKNASQSLMYFWKNWTSLVVNEKRYGQTRTLSFTIDQWSCGGMWKAFNTQWRKVRCRWEIY